jgi:hypothetical protein
MIFEKNGNMTTQRIENLAAYNMGFASGGVTCKIGALCFCSSLMLVDSFVLHNPHDTKSRNR